MDNHFHYRDYRVLPVEEEEETGSAGVIGVFSFGNDSLSTVCLDGAWPVGVQAVRAERQRRMLLPAPPGELVPRSDSGRFWLFSVRADAVRIPLCPLFKKGHGVARVASPLPSGRRDAWCGTECAGPMPGLCG